MLRKTKKIGKMNEAAWLLRNHPDVLSGWRSGTKAGFGVSMIAAPAYILHLKLVSFSAFFTQGTCEYLCKVFY